MKHVVVDADQGQTFLLPAVVMKPSLSHGGDQWEGTKERRVIEWVGIFRLNTIRIVVSPKILDNKLPA